MGREPLGTSRASPLLRPQLSSLKPHASSLPAMLIHKRPLERLAIAVFEAVSCNADEARCVAEHLVEANLVGHDSHGVIRIPTYVNWVREGKLFTNREPK